MYLQSIEIERERFPTHDLFPFSLKILRNTPRIVLDAPVTFLVGENGSGKSAVLDAVARKGGFLPWGGTKVHRVHDNPYETQLANYITLDLEPRHPYGFYFRAEAFFNFAASLDDIILDDPARDKYFGGGSLNVLSHGEAFLNFFRGYSFQLDGLYLLDEPEAALSPANQLEFVRLILGSLQNGNRQYIVATHSPILLGCPGARILTFDDSEIRPISFAETRHYTFYRDFLNDPDRYFRS
ncbi:MAG: AAA family ATPase [Thermodesulfobacteriota bacterium]